MIWLVILALGLAAGTIGGIVGFGSSIMLMPALMLAFGPQEAVPIMAIAAIMRPTLQTISRPKTETATATSTGGRFVMASKKRAANGQIIRKMCNLPY